MVDPALRAFAASLLDDLQIRFPLRKEPHLVWKAMRVSAGIAHYRKWEIRLSTSILDDEAKVRDTLIHEYAHLLAVERNGPREAGHGKGWQLAMRDLGAEPSVRHSYPVERNQKRQRVVYRCQKCGTEFSRARRLPSRRHYVHATCGGGLRLLRIERITPAPVDA